MFWVHPLQVYLVLFDSVEGVVSDPQKTWDTRQGQALVQVVTPSLTQAG